VSLALDTGLLDAFAAALDAERSALLARDAEALRAACVAKNDCLRRLAQVDAGHFAPGPHAERLRALAELNRANGELIVNRRRDVEWTLARLGRGGPAPAYDPNGMIGTATGGRDLALA
jgi:hypothetical protein